MPDLRHQWPLLHHRGGASCRAGAATASRCGCSSTSSRRPIWCRCSRRSAGANSWWRAARAGDSWSPRTNASPIPARASRSSTSPCPMRRAPSAWSTASIVAAIGENRKMLVFALDQVPEMDARPRRAPAALQGWRAVRHQDVQGRRIGLTWTDSAGRQFTLDAEGARRLARQPRRCRTHRPEGLPALEQVRMSCKSCAAQRPAQARARLSRSASCGHAGGGQIAPQRVAAINPVMHQKTSDEGTHAQSISFRVPQRDRNAVVWGSSAPVADACA